MLNKVKEWLDRFLYETEDVEVIEEVVPAPREVVDETLFYQAVPPQQGTPAIKDAVEEVMMRPVVVTAPRPAVSQPATTIQPQPVPAAPSQPAAPQPVQSRSQNKASSIFINTTESKPVSVTHSKAEMPTAKKPYTPTIVISPYYGNEGKVDEVDFTPAVPKSYVPPKASASRLGTVISPYFGVSEESGPTMLTPEPPAPKKVLTPELDLNMEAENLKTNIAIEDILDDYTVPQANLAPKIVVEESNETEEYNLFQQLDF